MMTHTSHSQYALLLAEHIEFENDIDSPIFLKVTRNKTKAKIKKTLFKAQTAFQMTDANRTVHFNNEFCMKMKIVPKRNSKTFAKQIVNVKLGLMNAKRKKRENIGLWRFDAANLENPNGVEVRTSQTTLRGTLGKATLYFRCVLVHCDEYPDGPPENFFSFVTNRVASPQVIDIIDNLTTATLTESSFDGDDGISLNVVKIVPNKSSDIFHTTSKLASFLKPIEKKEEAPPPPPPPPPQRNPRRTSNTDGPDSQKKEPISKVAGKATLDMFLNKAKTTKKPEKVDINDDDDPNLKGAELLLAQPHVVDATASQYYGEFNKLFAKHQKAVMDLAVNQCLMSLVQAVVSCLIAPLNAVQDFSDLLMSPLNAYGILQLPSLTPEVLYNLLNPLFEGISFTISQPHKIDELFGILATTLNFGLKLSSTSSLYTSAHIKCLTKTAPFITQLIQQLTQTLVATIAPSISQDGFDFADDESMAMIEQQTRLFLQYAHAFQIPEQIVQVVVIETCNYLDTLLYNVIVDTADQFTDEKITALLQKIRQIQKMFECLPNNFQTAFTNLLQFISMTKALWTGLNDDVDKRVKKNPLLRSIIERCEPPIPLPEGTTLDDIGEKVETAALKIPLATNSFVFSFEWLYTQNATSTWDNLE